MVSTVLVIEDDAANRKVMQDLLEYEGYEVTAIEDGFKAIETAERIKPNLIILDIQLVQTSGIDIAQNLRKHSGLSKIPVVVVSALAMKGDREKIIRESQCNAYIRKPFFKDEFIEVVKRYIV